MYIPTTTLTQGGGGDFTQIYDELLAGTQASFDVTGIDGSYKELRVVVMLRGTNASQNVVPQLRFNNASGASDYEWAGDYNNTANNDAAWTGDSTDSFIRIGFCPAASATAGKAARSVIQIPDYAGTTFQKGCLISNIGMGAGGSNEAYRFDGGGGWLSTAAITRITILPSAGSWAADSRITIYGIG